MRFSDIKEKHIYYVDFNPTRTCEFDRKHLAIVLKKNKDNNSIIVVPITTSPHGKEKINLGKISNLPSNLRNSDSFLVYNQVRTVNCSRFSEPLDNKKPISVPVTDSFFINVLSYCLADLLTQVSLADKVEYYKNSSDKLRTEQIVNLAYSIKKLKADSSDYSQEIQEIETQIKEAIFLQREYDYKKYISQKDLNAIQTIIDAIKL